MDDGFEQVAAPEPVQERGDRPPRVPLKAIENINLEAKIPLFYKVSRDSPTTPLVDKYSREALIVFSDRAKRDLSGGAKMFIFHGGDQQAIKDVLEWIMLCVTAGKAEKFQDYDDNLPQLFTKYAHAIEAANYLGIPARDFAEGVTKKMVGIARKKLMPWEEVEHFYDMYEDNGLREVAAASVFFGWWRGELDEDKTPDDMCFLSVLREQLPELDQDLHMWAEKNEVDIRARWAKKDEEKRGGGDFDKSGVGESGGGIGAGWDEPDQGATGVSGGWDQTADAGGGAGGDWDDTPAAAPVGAGGWDSAPVASSGDAGEWDSAPAAAPVDDRGVGKENAAPSGGSSGLATPAPTASGSGGDESAAGTDWADEVNEAQNAPAW